MSAIVLALLSQLSGTSGTSLNLNQNPILCMDEGLYCRADRKQAFELNCSGAGISCAQTGGRMTVTVSGGGGGGSPTVTCGSGEALSWNGTTWLCVNTITTSNRLPLTCASGDFVTCNGTTCSCATPSGGGGGISQSTAQRLIAIGGP